MHLSGGWVLLIARDREHVLEWQWAVNESAQAYTALLERLAPADVVTTDGAAGALAAIAHLWPSTRVQRCLVHVHRACSIVCVSVFCLKGLMHDE